jgi:hypothetical protein
MKEFMAKEIAKQMKKLPKEKKRGFMQKFWEKNKNNPDVEKHVQQMKEMIGYESDDFRD